MCMHKPRGCGLYNSGSWHNVFVVLHRSLATPVKVAQARLQMQVDMITSLDHESTKVISWCLTTSLMSSLNHMQRRHSYNDKVLTVAIFSSSVHMILRL